VAGNGCQIFQRAITELGFPEESFDFVISRLVLEHLPDPMPALKEVFRVLKVGARAVFLDNDFDLHERTWPDSPALCDLYTAYRRARRADGGNPCIGRQLPLLMKQAGFTAVDLHLIAAHNKFVGDKAFLKAEGAGIAAQLVRTGYLDPHTFEEVAGQWRSMLTYPDHAIFRMLFAVAGEKSERPGDTGPVEARSISIGNGAEVAADVNHGIGELRSREQIQQFMREILAEEMKIPAESIPANESLIHLGVDSMAALTLCSAVEARLGKTLSIAELLCGSSIEDLAGTIVFGKST
jgi:acyl carrier protein